MLVWTVRTAAGHLQDQSVILAIPVDVSNLSQALKHYTQLTWGQNEQLEFSDEEEYYYALGLLCLNSWFPITFQKEPKGLTVQYRNYWQWMTGRIYAACFSQGRNNRRYHKQ